MPGDALPAGLRTSGSAVLRRVVAAVRIVRPLTCVVAAIAPVYGVVLSGGMPTTTAGAVGLVALAMACVMGVANTVNDIVDLPADRAEAGKARRPLPSARLTVPQAWTVAGALGSAAVAASVELGVPTTVATCALLALSVLYSYRLKDTVLLGNLTVAVVCASTLLTGAVAGGGELTRPVWLATAAILLFMLAYEIVKTVQDADADAAAGLTTVATVHGPAASVRVYTLAAGALAVVTLGGAAASSRPASCIVAVLACVVAPVGSCLVLLVRAGASGRPVARCLVVLRLAWLPALTSLLLLA